MNSFDTTIAADEMFLSTAVGLSPRLEQAVAARMERKTCACVRDRPAVSVQECAVKVQVDIFLNVMLKTRLSCKHTNKSTIG
jgi:hypothetical protein